MDCFADFAEICRRDAPLAPLTWYRLGGPARWLLTPRDEAELAALLRRCAEQQIPWRVLGHGANVLVRDEGFDGAVIQLSAPAWTTAAWDGSLVRAGGGADFPKLVKQSVERGLAGLEALAGIPGTVGGVVRMNAGGKHGSLSQFVQEARLLDAKGTPHRLLAHELGFGYRRSGVPGFVVVEASFALRQAADPAEVRQRFQEIWKEKAATQAAMGDRSAGCMFRNPPGEAAGRILDRLGLKGQRCGGARISERHANFIVAESGATAQNVLDLVALAQSRARAEAGIDLELEIEVW